MTKNQLKALAKLKLKKYREEGKKFIIEGEHLLNECIKSPTYRNLITDIIVADDYQSISIIKGIQSYKIHYVSRKDLLRLSDTVTPQGIAAIVNFPTRQQQIKGDIILALEEIKDPGNLGTIFRIAHWFGYHDIIISSTSVDHFNPKVIRASQGSIFYINLHREVDLYKIIHDFYNTGFEILLTVPRDGHFLQETKFSKDRKYILVFGNEASGISHQLLKEKGYKKLTIKGYSDCESLNVTTAASILLYEIRKQIPLV
ncbi:MAG: TrmH family RNA methyltransferase [Ignavibacteria bacterium]